MQTVMSLAASILVQGNTQKLVYDATQPSALLEQLSTFTPAANLPAQIGHVLKDKSCNGFTWIYQSFDNPTQNILGLYAIRQNVVDDTPILWVDTNNILKIPATAHSHDPESLVSKQMVNDQDPVGTLKYFFTTVKPSELYWLKCNGRVFKTASSPDLYKVLQTDILPTVTPNGYFIPYIKAAL